MVSKKIRATLMEMFKTQKIVTFQMVEAATHAQWRVRPYAGAVSSALGGAVRSKLLVKVGHGLYALNSSLPTDREIAEFQQNIGAWILEYLGQDFPCTRTTDQIAEEMRLMDEPRSNVERKLRELRSKGAVIKVGRDWKLALAFATPAEISAHPLAPAPLDIFS